MRQLSPRPQREIRRAWVMAAVAAGGLGTIFVWPPAAVAITFVAAFLALGSVVGANLRTTQIASKAAAALHAIALGWASGSTLLGLAAFVPLALTTPPERAVRSLGYASGYLLIVIELIAIGLFAAAWPTGPWGWGAVPALVAGAWSAVAIPMTVRQLRRSGPARWPVPIGEPAPAVRAPTRDGGAFDLDAERGRWVLLCFLRGDWCPVCQVMMRIYRKAAPELARHGVKLVAVSPRGGDEAREFARDFGIDYAILVDPDLAIARSFGAVHPKAAPDGSDTALPVSFLIDPQGVVRSASRSDDVGSFDDPLTVLARVAA